MEGFLLPAFVYLFAALIGVAAAHRLGLGSVLGYLLAGVAIGPALNLVGTEAGTLHSAAEFGVVMMLFLVGLELDPKVLWQRRVTLLGLGGLQVAGTVLAIAALGLALGLDWPLALAAGLILASSSTAIVLQTLKEKGLMPTVGGRSSFAVLLFQDIAVIPILALIPLLARVRGGDAPGPHGEALSLVAQLPGWVAALATLAAIAAVILGGHYLSRPIFRFIARARLRELFTAAALTLVVAIALLMMLVGLSPALGAFLGGLVLANSEFRHELESDIEPFKGLLLGLFFITVGAGIDVHLLAAEPATLLGLTLGLMLAKGALLFLIAKLFGLRDGDRWLFALALAQAGEFGFVLIGLALGAGLGDPAFGGRLSLIITLSMLLTPLLFLFYDRVIAPRQARPVEGEADTITHQGNVIIAGHGRFGQVINRMLLANGIKTVVLDHQAELVDDLRKFGVRTFYGDATRPDLLEAAGIGEARMLIVAIDDPDQVIALVKYARRLRPDLHIVARASDRLQVYTLFQAGANDIIRELFDSSVRAGRSALEALGWHPFRAQKAVEAFVKYDRTSMRMLAEVWDPEVSIYENPAYMRLAKARNAEIERAMQGRRTDLAEDQDRAWATPPSPTESGPQ